MKVQVLDKDALIHRIYIYCPCIVSDSRDMKGEKTKLLSPGNPL